MTDEVRAILDKKADDVTEEEKKLLDGAKMSYAHEVSEVCKKHGWQHVPFLEVTASGVLPKLAIVPFLEKPEAPVVEDVKAE